jgi:hypothetical protein
MIVGGCFRRGCRGGLSCGGDGGVGVGVGVGEGAGAGGG